MKSIPASLFVALALTASSSSPAQTPPPSSAVIAPVSTTITAGYNEIWSNEAGTETYLIFKDNVVVTGTNLRITCDRIDATLVGKNQKPDPAAKTGTADDVEKFKTIVATGKVHIVQGDREANCERAEIFPREGKIVLTGTSGQPPVIIDRKFDVTWIADPAVLLKNERRVMGTNVKVIGPALDDFGFKNDAPISTPPDTTKP